ncbi:MAG TPA: tol-pal system-associated acyl-CoA thioesterase [Micavibrio sp.]|jgi:acyl-CoA thioester hydrolase
MTHHKTTFRVYYEDTDAGGIVYYANYLKFAERGRTEMLRAAGFENQSLMDREGLIFIVRRVEADYLAPARLDDVLTVDTSILSLKNASFLVKQSIFCHEVLVCSLIVTLVCVTKDIKPVRMPDAMREKLKPFQDFEKEITA